MNSSRFLAVLSLGLVITVGSSTRGAQTSNIWENFNLDGVTVNTVEDISREARILDVNASGTIDAGDVFLGMFKVEALSFNIPNSPNFHDNADPGWKNEFTGVFMVEVATKSATSVGTTSGTSHWATYDFTFAPYAGAAGFLNSSFGFSNWQSNTMMALFDDSTRDFNQNSTTGDVSKALDGTNVWQFGFQTGVATNGEGWTARAIDNPALIGTDLRKENIGFYELALNVTYANSIVRDIMSFNGILGMDGVSLVAIQGGGELTENLFQGDNPNSIWPIADKITINFTATPEPGSVAALAGIALVGLVGRIARRRKNS